MLSRLPARVSGEIQTTPDVEIQRRDDAALEQPTRSGSTDDAPIQRQVDSVAITREGEDRLLEREPTTLGSARAPVQPEPASTSEPGAVPGGAPSELPFAPAPTNDLENRAAAIEAYREVASSRSDMQREVERRELVGRTEANAPEPSTVEVERPPTPVAESEPVEQSRPELREDIVEQRSSPEPEPVRVEEAEARARGVERGVDLEQVERELEVEDERVERQVEAPAVRQDRIDADERAGGRLPDPTYG